MATTYPNLTSVAVMTNLVVTAYDKYFEFALRSQPMFRSWVDKRPVNVTNPGESVVFNIYKDFAQATSTLSEAVAPDPVSMINTSQVTVTLNEYGNWANETVRLQQDALSDVDSALANQLAYNCMDSLDSLIQTKLATATQVGRRAAGAFGFNSFDGVLTNAPAVTGVVGTDTIKSSDVRTIVATMRNNKVLPRVGGSYIGAVSPYVSADLQSETGAAAWRDPHTYNAGGVSNIWSGVLGEYQGAVFVETPRLNSAQSGSGTGGTQYRVYDNYFLGQQAIAEAVNIEPSVRSGPVVDPFHRFLPIGWYGFLGWNLFRQESTFKYQVNATGRAQA